MRFDKARYEYFQTQLKSNTLFRRFFIFWGIYGIIFVPLEVLMVLRVPNGGQAFILSVIAYFITWPIIAHAINTFYKKQRPYQRFGYEPVYSSVLFSRVRKNRFNSFPSRHTMALSAVAMVLLFYSTPVGVVGLAIAAWVGLSRIVLSYHYPIDVIAGFILGCVCGWLVYVIGAPLLFT